LTGSLDDENCLSKSMPTFESMPTFQEYANFPKVCPLSRVCPLSTIMPTFQEYIHFSRVCPLSQSMPAFLEYAESMPKLCRENVESMLSICREYVERMPTFQEYAHFTYSIHYRTLGNRQIKSYKFLRNRTKSTSDEEMLGVELVVASQNEQTIFCGLKIWLQR